MRGKANRKQSGSPLKTSLRELFLHSGLRPCAFGATSCDKLWKYLRKWNRKRRHTDTVYKVGFSDRHFFSFFQSLFLAGAERSKDQPIAHDAKCKGQENQFQFFLDFFFGNNKLSVLFIVLDIKQDKCAS